MGAVIIDEAAGTVRIGRTEVAISRAGSRGELRVGSGAGAVLKPVSFGERSRLAARAIDCASPRDALCAGVLAASMVVGGDGERLVMEILALALAGAEEAGPAFVDAAMLVARATGWSPATLYDAEAAEVDRIARRVGDTAPGTGGWTRLWLVGQERALDDVRCELADRLLERAGRSGDLDAQASPHSDRRARTAADDGPTPEARAAIAMAMDGSWRRSRASGVVEASLGEPAADRAARDVVGGREVGAARARRDAPGPFEVAAQTPRVVDGTPRATRVPEVAADGFASGASDACAAALRADARIAAMGAWDTGAWRTVGGGRDGEPAWGPPLTVRSARSAEFAPLAALAPEPSRTDPALAPPPLDVETIADEIAALLHDECDLRGIDR